MNRIFFGQNQRMPTAYSKDFFFESGVDGWTSSPASGEVAMSWQRPKNKGQAKPNPPISKLAGQIRTTALAGAAAGISNWELSTSWASLGVPSTKVIQMVKASYLFRYHLRRSGSGINLAEFSAADTGCGPFEVRTSDGSILVASLSAFQQCGLDRPHLGEYWPCWPAGHSDDPVSLTPPSWKLVTGANQSVPSAYASAATAIRLRLSVKTPSVGTAMYSSVRIWTQAIRLIVYAV